MVPSDFSLRFPFPREVRSNRRGSFFEFFSLLFFARKIDASKTHFSPHFWRFLAIFAPKMGDLGSIWGAWGRLFVTILLIESKLHFFTFFLVFLLDFQYFSIFAKTLFSCRVACKIHGFSRVGNTSKKHNNVMFFSSFFDQKWAKKGMKNEVMHCASPTLL